MKVSLVLTFLPNSFTSAQLSSLIQHLIKFSPTQVTAGKRGRVRRTDPSKIAPIFNEFDPSTDTISIERIVEEERSHITFTSHEYPPVRNCIYLNCSLEELPELDNIRTATESDGFIDAYCSSVDYEYWQNEPIADVFYKSSQSLDGYTVVRGPAGQDRISLQDNPGRTRVFPVTSGSRVVWAGMLASSWRMWFSSKVEPTLSLKKLANYHQANNVERMKNGGLFIELFSSPEDDLGKGKMAILRDFATYSGIFGLKP